jgi:hypothetical protein
MGIDFSEFLGKFGETGVNVDHADVDALEREQVLQDLLHDWHILA